VTAGTGARAHRGTVRAWLSRAPVPLCLCALLLSCTDPRARVTPPTIRITVSPIFQVHSPGTIPTSVYAYDFQGFDSVDVAVRSTGAPLNADSLFLYPDTTEATTDVVWSVPAGIPLGTKITVAAKVWNLVGFVATDSSVVTIQ